MKFTREQLLQAVVECLRKMQRGADDIVIGEETDPFRDLGCDSFDGVDFACSIEEALGVIIPGKVNPLVDDACKRPRKVKEIVALLQNLSAKETNDA